MTRIDSLPTALKRLRLAADLERLARTEVDVMTEHAWRLGASNEDVAAARRITPHAAAHHRRKSAAAQKSA